MSIVGARAFTFGLLLLQVWPALAQSLRDDASDYVRFREAHKGGYYVDLSSKPGGKLAAAASPQWLRAWPDNGSTNSLELGSRVVLRLKEARDLPGLIADRPLRLARRIDDTLFILQAEDAASAVRQAASLALDPRTTLCHPVTRRPKQLFGRYAPRPNDPFFYQPDTSAEQWQVNLENRDTNGVSLGVDLNVREAWGVTQGEGIMIALSDEGIELDHPDLVQRTGGSPHFNFLSGLADGAPSGFFSYHGTAVAGLVAATANNQRGISGVAPKAQLASWVIFGANGDFADEEALMDMFQYQSNVVSVQNHSWGKDGIEQLRLSSLEDLAISNAVTRGRAGRGVVMVRAAGNGRDEFNDVNEDAYAADPRVIVVGAVRLDGKVTRYSSPGACVLVGAPSGDVSIVFDPCLTDSPNLVTTDRQGVAGYNKAAVDDDTSDYAWGENGFNGTSASTPQISGIVALMLAANPKLTYRDVQQVLIHASRHYDFSEASLVTNGAGFTVSHNIGFGIPDAGRAVDLARSWSNRPPAETVSYRTTNLVHVPDPGLVIRVEGPDVPANLQAIRAIPGAGPQPDVTTALWPLVNLGNATETITADLRGKAALIQRGPNFFCEKIGFASQAGAELAMIYNNRGGDNRVFMVESDLAAIPSVFISQLDGEALRDYLAAQPEARVQMRLDSARVQFDVPDTLQCEFVGVRLDSTHSARGDLRIVLTAPSGTRSVLQRVNQDTLPGPSDWTYYSVQHFYETSFGRWTLTVTDEDDGGQGDITSAELILTGVRLHDRDHDGLDDEWENRWLQTLAFGPADDPDRDGLSNAREQVLGSDPGHARSDLTLDLSLWDSRLARLSWPSNTNTLYRVQIGAESVRPLTLATNLAGQAFETEWFVPYTNVLHQFFRVQAVSKGN